MSPSIITGNTEDHIYYKGHYRVTFAAFHEYYFFIQLIFDLVSKIYSLGAHFAFLMDKA